MYMSDNTFTSNINNVFSLRSVCHPSTVFAAHSTQVLQTYLVLHIREIRATNNIATGNDNQLAGPKRV